MKKRGTALPSARSSPGDADEVMSLPLENADGLVKVTLWRHIRSAGWLVILSVPLIYTCAVPFILLDVSVALYQTICFPIYGIPKVRRRDYLIFDRGRLAYLNAIEKVGCVYCSYANGLLAYVAEIAARTEQRFCPIKHAHIIAQPHSRYLHFLPYGDAKAYRARSEVVASEYGDLASHTIHTDSTDESLEGKLEASRKR
jgi:hypothetical protein